MDGYITIQEHLEVIAEVYGREVAEKFAASDAPSWLAFMVQENMI